MVITLNSWFENLSLLRNILSVTKDREVRRLGKGEFYFYFSATISASRNI